MKICGNCNSQNKDNNVFCSSCGQKLENIGMSNQASVRYEKPTYKISFKRPHTFQWHKALYYVQLDNGATYDLKDDCEITFNVFPGQHSAKVSVFSMPRSKKFTFQVTSDMTFVCEPVFLAAGGWGLVMAPVKVTDSNGSEY